MNPGASFSPDILLVFPRCPGGCRRPILPISSSVDPYERLAIPADAPFDAVQAARDARLEEVGEDPMARSRVEAAYDAVLMDRLKERQQGRVSSAARSASQREQAAAAAPPQRPTLPQLPQLPQLASARLAAPRFSMPSLALASGRDFWFPLGAQGLLLVLLFALSAAPAELLLALATLVTVISLQRRNVRFLAAVGWSFALLALGLMLGGLLLGAINPSLPLGLPIGELQVQSLPALLLLLLGALLIA